VTDMQTDGRTDGPR